MSNSTSLPEEISRYYPFCGRVIIKVITETVSEHLGKQRGLDKTDHLKNAGFQIVSAESVEDEYTGKKILKMNDNLRVPYQKGVLIKLSPDAFGEVFKKNRGNDIGPVPELGDTVWFFRNMTYPIDAAMEYHLLNDTDIVGFERKQQS